MESHFTLRLKQVLQSRTLAKFDQEVHSFNKLIQAIDKPTAAELLGLSPHIWNRFPQQWDDLCELDLILEAKANDQVCAEPLQFEQTFDLLRPCLHLTMRQSVRLYTCLKNFEQYPLKRRFSLWSQLRRTSLIAQTNRIKQALRNLLRQSNVFRRFFSEIRSHSTVPEPVIENIDSPVDLQRPFDEGNFVGAASPLNLHEFEVLSSHNSESSPYSVCELKTNKVEKCLQLHLLFFKRINQAFHKLSYEARLAHATTTQARIDQFHEAQTQHIQALRRTSLCRFFASYNTAEAFAVYQTSQALLFKQRENIGKDKEPVMCLTIRNWGTRLSHQQKFCLVYAIQAVSAFRLSQINALRHLDNVRRLQQQRALLTFRVRGQVTALLHHQIPLRLRRVQTASVRAAWGRRALSRLLQTKQRLEATDHRAQSESARARFNNMKATAAKLKEVMETKAKQIANIHIQFNQLKSVNWSVKSISDCLNHNMQQTDSAIRQYTNQTASVRRHIEQLQAQDRSSPPANNLRSELNQLRTANRAIEAQISAVRLQTSELQSRIAFERLATVKPAAQIARSVVHTPQRRLHKQPATTVLGKWLRNP